VSGVDGLRWTVRFGGAVDPDSPDVRTLTRKFVAQAQAGLAGAGR
jgi:hypothetical protein